MYAYAQSAVERGIKVIIAGAGGAAHLPVELPATFFLKKLLELLQINERFRVLQCQLINHYI